jgi:HEAT repeat protein/VWA domain-containing protein
MCPTWKRLLALLLAALGVLAPLAVATSQGGGDDEILAEFKRYYRKYKDTPTRVEAVLSLEGCEQPEVVAVLAPLFDSAEPEVGIAVARVLSRFKTRPPVDAILAELVASSGPPVKLGLLRALALGKYTGTASGIQPLLADSSWDVRRRALQALAALADPSTAEAIAALCNESEVGVRCAALDALASLHSQLVLAPAIADLDHDSWQVRSSAIAALGTVRHVSSIGPLIRRMAVEEGRLIEDISRALARITGRDFGSRLEGWQNFWKSAEDKFQIPTDAELEKLRAVQAERKIQYEGPPGAVAYYGVQSPSQSIVFVIDVSGSMEQEVVNTEKFKGTEYPSWKRIDVIKTELIKTIKGLEPYVDFNIIAFATDVMPWKKGQVKANPLNKSSAETWINRLEAIGGASKEDLARAGLVGAANLEAGKTNTYAALMTALGVQEGKESRDYETKIDTIFFLSDGRPSHGRFIEPDDVLREVRAANELRRVVIHTINLGEFETDFMESLARENGGTFVNLGN